MTLGTGNTSPTLRLLPSNPDTTVSPNVVEIGFWRSITQQAIGGGTLGNDGLDFCIGGNLTTPKMWIDAGDRKRSRLNSLAWASERSTSHESFTADQGCPSNPP